MKKLQQLIENKKQNTDQQAIYRKLLGLIDLTTLEGTDHEIKIKDLCSKAIKYKVAAVCVYPNFVRLAKKELENTDIHVASVAGAFPSGQTEMKIKLQEVEYALTEGADEIDMVISRGKMLRGEHQIVFDEIKKIKEVCELKHLKVILETGELKEESIIRQASQIAIDAGADFIKTSTGKIQPAATLPAFYTMLQVIQTHYSTANKMIGIKPAGGISDPETALDYYLLLEEVLGEKWLNKKYFRIGASRLADALAHIISK